MKEYYFRIVGAWILLLVANRILKSAEKVMREAAQALPQAEAPITVEVEA